MLLKSIIKNGQMTRNAFIYKYKANEFI